MVSISCDYRTQVSWVIVEDLLRIRTWLKAIDYENLWESSLGNDGEGLIGPAFDDGVQRGRPNASTVVKEPGLYVKSHSIGLTLYRMVMPIGTPF